MPRRSDSGAAAVEFALVAPVLFLLLFGIIDYGLWFADSIAVRQSAAEGARRAVAWSDLSSLPPWGKKHTCGTWDGGTSVELEALGCSISANTDTLSGPVYVKIRILDSTLSSDATPTSGMPNWTVRNAVRVCLLQDHQSVSGFIPLPRRWVTAYVDMPIEDFTGRTLVPGGRTDLPAGANWDWCDG